VPAIICPLCQSAAIAIPLHASSWRYTCPTCGIFEFRDDVLESFPTEEHWDETRLLLSKVARSASDEGQPLKLETISGTRTTAKDKATIHQDDRLMVTNIKMVSVTTYHKPNHRLRRPGLSRNEAGTRARKMSTSENRTTV